MTDCKPVDTPMDPNVNYYQDKGSPLETQVISLYLRSNLKETAGSNGYSGHYFAEESCSGEIDYVKTLNRVLPNDIRVIGWSPAPTDFSARFSCLSREYKYFFWRENLNITVMEIAGKKFIGEHDFRNFCKMDAANVHNFRRHITSFEIFPCNERFEDAELWAVKIKGSAFLWHQIRCMVAVLFMIGQGLESPNMSYWILKEHQGNLNTQWLLRFHWFFGLVNLKVSSLSVHQFASYACFVDLFSMDRGHSFVSHLTNAAQALHTHLEKECRSYKLQAAIFHEAMLSSSCAFYATYKERRAKLNAGVGKKKVPVADTL
ncbi:tRNA pseudouridine(38/39) synthase [Phtheirospermum japonicum]|uniref:tRNA pseudouridine synthase n=1 Tax=Phtheirospermum japonicum TaxID=374723 RepID=A0A830B261_9LAMI|nr:tRNA pseudouridine(38/39) synthase [Phtheirospermum japonicum]